MAHVAVDTRILIRFNVPGTILTKSVCVCVCKRQLQITCVTLHSHNTEHVCICGWRMRVSVCVRVCVSPRARRVYYIDKSAGVEAAAVAWQRKHTHTRRHAAERESEMSCVGLGAEPPSNTAELILHIVPGTSGTAINKRTHEFARVCATATHTRQPCECVYARAAAVPEGHRCRPERSPEWISGASVLASVACEARAGHAAATALPPFRSCCCRCRCCWWLLQERSLCGFVSLSCEP